jgi:hypothetical protein
MNFVLVNGRTPHRESFCGLCCQRIGDDGYVRDIRTRLCYCRVTCYAVHCGSTMMLLEERAKASRPASRTLRATSVHN